MPQIRRPTELRPRTVHPDVVDVQVARLNGCAERLSGTTHTPDSAAELVAGWLATPAACGDSSELVDRHQLQLQAARDAESRRALQRWDRASDSVGMLLLSALGAARPGQDARLMIGAIDGLRLYELGRGRFDRDQVQRQLERLLKALVRTP